MAVSIGSTIKKIEGGFLVESVHNRLPPVCKCDPTNDIGLIKTVRKFEYGPRVAPIRLWPEKFINTSWTLQEAAFGKTDDKKSSRFLQKVTRLKILPHKQCYAMLSKLPHLGKCLTNPNSHICTYTKGVAQLPGDSGAGIVLERANTKYLAAVCSCGSLTIKAAKYLPGVHTRVYPHLNWIRQTSGISP